MIKAEVFPIFLKKKIKIIYFVIILVEFWLVELKYVAFCHTHIGPFYQKMVKIKSFVHKMIQNELLSDFLT